MPVTILPISYTCVSCLRAAQRPARLVFAPRASQRKTYHDLSHRRAQQASRTKDTDGQVPIEEKPTPEAVFSNPRENEERGAMSRRLRAATDDALLEGGRAGRKAVEEAGFSEELKVQLLERVAASSFRSENATAFAEAELKGRVGRGSRDIAIGDAWTGDESTADTVLRMLDDTRKPLKPGLRGLSKVSSPIVDMRLKPTPKSRPGQRLANARDKTSIYAISKDAGMTDKEREDMRRDLKERFAPAARAMPNSIRGLAALANERIEDAISRGQFKNIPRGKAIERDARADNPFIDTTEYIMNKMIQRQDIVPPWIEKQQELVKAASVFRARLRNDWKRHAARTIASRGGSLQEQMKRADQYAEAERVYNPKKRAVETISVPATATNDPVMIKIIQDTSTAEGGPNVQVIVGIRDSEALAEERVPAQSDGQSFQQPQDALPVLFRSPAWEAGEQSYLNLAVTNLNSITRSYNLMAPALAKKPYFSLERELKSCYADVAPQLSEAIKDRAARPARELVEKMGHTPGGVLERFAGDTAKIYDSKRPRYGFKEFWNELFAEKRE